MNQIEPQQGLDCVRIKFQMRLYLEQELAVDQTPPPHQGTIQRGIPRWGDQGVFLHMTQLLLLGKFEYTGGPIFKVVLEC